MKSVYCGRGETDEEFNRTCYVLTTIHPAGLGVLFALVGWLVYHMAPLVAAGGGLVMFGIVSGLNRRNVKRFRKLRELYQKGVFL